MAIDFVQLIPIGPSDPAGTQGISTVALDATGVELKFDVRAYAVLSVQAVFSVGATTGVLTLYRSNDGANPVALATATTITTSATMTDAIDCTGFGYLHVRVTTADSGDTARIYALAKASS